MVEQTGEQLKLGTNISNYSSLSFQTPSSGSSSRHEEPGLQKLIISNLQTCSGRAEAEYNPAHFSCAGVQGPGPGGRLIITTDLKIIIFNCLINSGHDMF